jgi:type IV secretory pathway TraG/TraD family ATPase VirD4
MGNLSVIVEQANLVRKRRIAFLIACQTVGQLYNIYGRDGAHTLLAGMATQIVFGGADKETATYFHRWRATKRARSRAMASLARRRAMWNALC